MISFLEQYLRTVNAVNDCEEEDGGDDNGDGKKQEHAAKIDTSGTSSSSILFS